MFLAELVSGGATTVALGKDEFCLSRGVCVRGAWEWGSHGGGSWLSGLGLLEKLGPDERIWGLSTEATECFTATAVWEITSHNSLGGY